MIFYNAILIFGIIGAVTLMQNVRSTESVSLIERVRLSFYLYFLRLYGKLSVEKISDNIFDLLNYASILTLELTLLLMATGYLYLSPYFVISTCIPIAVGLMLFTFVRASNLETSLRLIIEVIRVSVIIGLSFYFPLGHVGIINLSIICYYFVVSALLNFGFEFLEVKELADKFLAKTYQLTSSNDKNKEYFSQLDIKNTSRNVFSLALPIVLLTVILPLNLLSLSNLTIFAGIFHIAVNLTASFFNRKRNLNAETTRNQVKPPMPHSWLIMMSKYTGILFVGVILTQLPILQELFVPLVNMLCDTNLVVTTSSLMSSATMLAIGIIAAKIIAIVIPELIKVFESLFLIDNLVDTTGDNYHPQNMQINFFYQVISHLTLLCLSLANIDLLFEDPKNYFKKTFCHFKGLTTVLSNAVYMYIIAPFNYLISRESGQSRVFLALANAELKVETITYRNTKSKSFIYCFEQPTKSTSKDISEMLKNDLNTKFLGKVNSTKRTEYKIKA